MRDHLDQLGLRDAVLERPLQVKRQFARSVERDERCDCDEASVAVRPDCVRREARNSAISVRANKRSSGDRQVSHVATWPRPPSLVAVGIRCSGLVR